MKVIKRDGRIVDFDKTKVIIAIEKANKEVRKKEKATKEDIKTITDYLEEIDKKRILVEDIQDIIEEKLMELGKFELAKKYIVYRYTRALVRKSNTTDETILGLIRNENKDFVEENSNKNTYLVSNQRDYIAGEVSRDLTKRLLLPEKISKANDEGVLYFHNADYFVQPIFNSCIINLEDMLDNGTVINGKMIDSPKSFQVACSVVTQIIAMVASSQYGEQAINIKHLGKYLRKSKEKIEKELKEEFEGKIEEEKFKKLVAKKMKSELKAGIQTIFYQINTLITTNGKTSSITIFLYLEQDEYIEENACIIEEILEQKSKGIKNQDGVYEITTFPKLVYVLSELNCLNGGKYDYLTNLTIKCLKLGANINYASAKKMKENYDGNVFCPCGGINFLDLWKDKNEDYKFEGRFTQGVVSINLPQIGIISEGNEDKFWKELSRKTCSL